MVTIHCPAQSQQKRASPSATHHCRAFLSLFTLWRLLSDRLTLGRTQLLDIWQPVDGKWRPVRVTLGSHSTVRYVRWAAKTLVRVTETIQVWDGRQTSMSGIKVGCTKCYRNLCICMLGLTTLLNNEKVNAEISQKRTCLLFKYLTKAVIFP